MMVTQTCAISGEKFEVSDLEIQLRKQFGVDSLPIVKPKYRFRELGAFWQHWNLHKRKCDKTGKDMVSVFSEHCPYPVWHKDEWMKNANPSGADFDETRSVFEQLWEFFQRSPIPHNVGTNNENCEYTDDWWHSKDCYLCHSGYQCENLRYCYRMIRCQDSLFGAFAFDSELCVDVTNSEHCFESFYLLSCKNIQNSGFLYDCRNCSDCLFCFNLRNKKYCFGNQQLTKEEFEKKREEWSFSSRKKYEEAKSFFSQMMKTMAWHRALQNDVCEGVTGNFLENEHESVNCFFFSDAETAVNVIRGGFQSHHLLDGTNIALEVELIFNSSGVLDRCYDIQHCLNVTKSKFLEYCAFCWDCEDCFGCCGLVGKKYHIFNKPYAPEEYKALRSKIIAKMKEADEWGQFFPGYFSAVPYDESWSSFYWPLSREEQKTHSFRVSEEEVREKESSFLSSEEIPDDLRNISQADSGQVGMTEKVFWDEVAKKPFQIQKDDVDFAQKLGIPLPPSHYMRRIQENFKWMFFDGELRKTQCAKSGESIETNWPKEYDGRILCEEEYLKILQ